MCAVVGLVLQVQSDHFEEFFAPELEKHGYTAVYKKKTSEVQFFLSKFWLWCCSFQFMGMKLAVRNVVKKKCLCVLRYSNAA